MSFWGTRPTATLFLVIAQHEDHIRFLFLFDKLLIHLKLANVCNYADNTTFHAYNSDLGNLINRLEQDSTLTIEWFESNYITLNKNECHFLLS